MAVTKPSMVTLAGILLVGVATSYAVAPENDPALFPPALKSALSNSENELDMARANVFQWLLAHRNPQWGWDPSTPEVIFALWSTNLTQASGYIQSTKQLEIEVLLHLCKGVPTTYIDRFLIESVLAMSAICLDPKEFHGYQLLDFSTPELLSNTNFSSFSRARAMYSACMGGAEISARVIQQLLTDFADIPSLHTEDALAQVALLLKCALAHSPSPALAETVPTILESVKTTLAQVPKNTSAYDLTTISVVAQALLCLANSTEEEEVLVAPLRRAMLDAQKADGSYGDDVAKTAQVLPGLASTCLITLRSETCRQKSTEPQEPSFDDGENGDALIFDDGFDDPETDVRQWVRVNYTVWIGLLVDKSYHKVVWLKENTTMYQMMMVAAENDGRFEFSTYEFPRGRYVHNIGGVELKHDGYHYWLLYVLPFAPDPTNPPPTSFIGTKGIDELILEDGMNILFWNKPI